MARPTPNPEIREFILRNVANFPNDIGPVTAKQFGVSRQTVSAYLQRLVTEGLLTREGNTRARTYKLRPVVDITETVPVTPGMDDDFLWRTFLAPIMGTVQPNVADIIQYGVNEMFNNVIDHSGSDSCIFSYEQDYTTILVIIADYGVGIFEKIRQHFNLADRRQALVELSKGKLTSDPKRHSGEGIFFTSRMFDTFSIDSIDLFYARIRSRDQEWLIEVEESQTYHQGTSITMRIATNSTHTTQGTFERYVDDEHRFIKTHVPLNVARHEGEQLVSRSQARRLLSRMDRFAEVMLDFNGVATIGQPFADEVFRVFKNDHPNVRIVAVNTTPEVDRMIEHVLANA